MQTKFQRLFWPTVLCTFFLTAVSAFGHHSYSSEFDDNRTFSETGVLKKIDWINPHVYFYLETKDAEGKPQTYEFESVALVGMRRHNLRKEDFRIGEVVTIFAAHAKDSKKRLGWIRNIKYSGGQIIRMPKNGIP
jgi:hypothetical protein